MAIYKKRSLVPIGETWDIESFLGGEKPDQLIEKSLEIAKKMAQLVKQRLESSDKFYEFLVLEERLDLTTSKVGNYLSLACAEDTLSPLTSKLSELFMKMQPYNELFAATDAEDIKHKETIKKYLKEERLKRWRRFYEKLFKKAEHILPERLAIYSAKIGDAFANNMTAFTTLTDAELKYEPAVDGKGKKHVVSSQSISILLMSDDRVLRKNAYLSHCRGELLYKETLATMLSKQFLAEYRLARSVNYPNQIYQSMDSDNVKPPLVLSLYEAAKLNLDAKKRLAKASRAFVAKKLKIPYAQVEPFDSEIELVGVKKLYTLQQAKKSVLDSVAILGADYTNIVKKAFEERWIDFHMTPNKTSGAFSAGVWGIEKKVILMNFAGDLRSISTLAHEMGHSMHSHYNHASNDFQHGSYPLFIAEVASIFSELLLTEHMLNGKEDDVVKFRFLQDFLSNFTGSVFYQLLFSEYEFRLVEAIEKGTPPSNFKALSVIYESVSAFYRNHDDWAKKYPEFQQTRAVNVPHYYMGFYVYKYAVGMIGALQLMSQVKENKDRGVANYLKFISSGTQQWPAEILQTVGVDLYDPKALQKAFGLFADYVEQYIQLGKKLLKVSAKL